tara:strand:- start:480 stop:1244 length:765 start_codon:yes stop_codon:yes gene_type:complete
MNIAIRVALVITTLICAFCAYLINDYRGRLKVLELAATSLEKKTTAAEALSSDLESANDKLEKDLKGLQAQIPLLMAQIEGASSKSGTAQSSEKETQRQLIDARKNLRLMASELDNYREASKEAKLLKRQLSIYQRLGTVAQLQGMKDRINTSQQTDGVVPNPTSKVVENRVKPKPGTELGVILSVDVKLGFCVINCGSEKDIAKGDEFHIHRAGNFVGKIRVDEVRPAVAIATAVKKFTPKVLRAGDKVIQGN